MRHDLMPMYYRLLLIALGLSLLQISSTTQAIDHEAVAYRYAIDLFGTREVRTAARQIIQQGNRTEYVPALVRSLRYFPEDSRQISHLLSQLTGKSLGNDWFEWQQWLETYPSPPLTHHEVYIAKILSRIDPEFSAFIYPNVPHRISLDEIVWGGVKKDGIPALTNPSFVQAVQANYLSEQELVFGISLNGDARAYPLRILDWHEMVNDVVGGIPVALTYCTLCNAGILYQTKSSEQDNVYIFGSSGLLYRSNKLMYDQATHSLWDQFSGVPVVGKLAQDNIALKVLPIVTTPWRDWHTQHPNTKVLNINTGYSRDYTPGSAYGSYFASKKLMYPASVSDHTLESKALVFTLRADDENRAWPLQNFTQQPILHEQLGLNRIVLIGNADTQTVRAYRAGNHTFSLSIDGQLIANNEVWKQTEEALVGPGEERLDRLPGHISYWFAWSNRFPNTLSHDDETQ